MENMRFGNLLVLEKSFSKHGIFWKCLCDCGNIKFVNTGNLNSGNVKSCGCLRKTVSGNRAKSGLNKKYFCNDNFFETIDTEEKAYWLGFIAADGNVYENRLTIEIQRRDIRHLYKFINNLEYDNRNIYTRNFSKNYEVSVTITSKKLVSDLLKYGITPKKSLTLDINLELIPENLHRHFWRGMIDGDGWISLRQNKNYTIGLCGTENVCEKFWSFVKNSDFISYAKVRYVRNNHYNVSFNSNVMKNVSNLLYDKASIYLDRKYKNYRKVVI